MAKASLRWHYTTEAHIFAIIRSCSIEPAGNTLRIKTAVGRPKTLKLSKKPIVWFSSNQRSEKTASRFGRRFRIGVSPETAPHDWPVLRRLGGITRRWTQMLCRTAEDVGANPNEWWGTFEPVPKSTWIAVQRFDGCKWVDVPPEEWRE